jgi:hypothetical protein
MDARNWNRHIVEKQVVSEFAGVAQDVFLYNRPRADA